MNPLAIEDRRDGSARRISAGAMSLAVAGDPQFRMPAHPRLADGLVIVPLDDGLLVEGAAERQVLRGRAATTLLPRLLPLLDGSRTVAETAAQLDLPLRAVAEACALLYTCGLLDEGTEAPATGELAAFVRRHVDTTRVNRSAEEALARIAATRVAVMTAVDGVDVAGELARSGFTVSDLVASSRGGAAAGAPGEACTDADVVASRRDGAAPGAPGEACTDADVVASRRDGAAPGALDGAWVDVDLAVAVGLDAAALTALDDACAARGIPWVRSAADGGGIELGPYFDRRHTACYRCFAATHGAEPVPAATPRAALWAGLLATEVVHLVGRVCQAITTRGLVSVDGGEARMTMVPRMPGCAHCAPPPVPLDPPPALALAHVYEQAVALPPRELLSPKDHQHHYKPANLALQHESKRHPGVRQWRLGADDAPAGGFLAPTPAEAALSATALSGLLRRTAGLREDARPIPGKVQRWAPTGGNLGSVELHVLLPAGLAGLPAGGYTYMPHEHALAAIRPDLDAAAIRALAGGGDALIVLSAAYGRVRRKYGDFALRVVHLDAGVAQAQFGAVARGYGLRARPLTQWDDAALLDALRLDTENEPITGVVALSGRGER